MQSKDTGICESNANLLWAQPSSDQLSEDNMNKNAERNQAIAGNELRALLQNQLEFYFSRENLAHDSYLLSQMDSDQYVPITTIANFEKVKSLTKDVDLIVEVLRESSNVQVDEAGEKVRPNHKRCVLILREIPGDTPINEVENLFNGKNCPKFVSCEFAHNNSWYVTFDTDDDAQRAYRYLREEVKIFHVTGKPIMARIKAKPIMHSATYKNGFRPTSGTSSPSLQANSDTYNFQSQRYQQYSNPNVPLNFPSQTMYQPFYPPTMLQAWAPTAAACYDLNAVLMANGLAPHVFAGTSRPYQGAKSSSGRGKGYNSRRVPHYRQYSGTSSRKSSAASYTEGEMNFNEKSTCEREVQNSAENSKATINANTYRNCNSNLSKKVIAFSNPNSYARTQLANEFSNDSLAASQRGKTHARGLRKKKDENSNDNYCDSHASVKSSYANHVVEQAPFDLEASAFPPLPIHDETESDTNSNGERVDKTESIANNSLADVVKGTVKIHGVYRMQNEFSDCTISENEANCVIKSKASLSNEFKNNSCNCNKEYSSDQLKTDSCVSEQQQLSNLSNLSASQKTDETRSFPAKSPSPILPSNTIVSSHEFDSLPICKISPDNQPEANEKFKGSSDDVSVHSNMSVPGKRIIVRSRQSSESICNGHSDINAETHLTDEVNTVRSQSPSLNTTESKRLTYSQIAQRAQIKPSQLNEIPFSAKEPRESISSNSSTCSSQQTANAKSNNKSGKTRGGEFGQRNAVNNSQIRRQNKTQRSSNRSASKQWLPNPPPANTVK